jgi:hypothetical protein
MATNPTRRVDPARERAGRPALAVGYRSRYGRAAGRVVGVPKGCAVAVPAEPGRVDSARKPGEPDLMTAMRNRLRMFLKG